MRNGKHRRHSHYTGKKRRDTAKLSEMLAPLEEKNPAQAQKQTRGVQSHNGAIIIDSNSLKVRSDFAETENEQKRILGMEPLVLTILLFILAFIGFIAYLISIEPSKS